jgi:hypothetical protein
MSQLTQLEKSIYLFQNTRNIIPKSFTERLKLDNLMIRYHREICDTSCNDINLNLYKHYYNYLSGAKQHSTSYYESCFLDSCKRDCKEIINKCATNVSYLVL